LLSTARVSHETPAAESFEVPAGAIGVDIGPTAGPAGVSFRGDTIENLQRLVVGAEKGGQR